MKRSIEPIGLVLSGGGVRGAAHIGILRAFQEKGIRIAAVSGASAGALVGAFLAGGYSPDDMLQFFKKTPLFHWSYVSWGKPGLLDSDRYNRVLKMYFPKDDFSDLSIPLYVSTTDLLSGKSIIFHQGQLIRPLLASAAFPVVFSPVRIGDRLFADGGILNNFPVEPLKNAGLNLVGSFVDVFPENVAMEDIDSSIKLLQRTYQLVTIRSSLAKFEECALVINPSALNAYFLFDKNHVQEIHDIGYEAGRKAVARLFEKL